jgi:RHS repeat-associated protein
LARINAIGGAVRYYHADALGSIIGLSDETGQEVTQYVYDPFGSVTISGEISDNPFQYTGRENDGTGLYYYRARYYSSELQRFISEDPIGFSGGSINLFSYVGNNPVNRRDPLGLQGIVPEVVPEYPWPTGEPEGPEPPEESCRTEYKYCCIRYDKCGQCLQKDYDHPIPVEVCPGREFYHWGKCPPVLHQG